MSKSGTNIPKRRFPEFRGEPEWKEKPLSKLLTIGSGRDYKHLSNGDIPVYGTGGYMLAVNDYLYDGESVCIGRKGTIDKPMFLTGKFWTVDTLFYTHSFKDCIPKYIYYYFGTINWYNYNEAGGVPSLSKTTLNKINIPIPPNPNNDLAEQQKIADSLTSIDNLILSSSKKVEALKEHKKGLMQQLFPKEGENVPNLRFPEFMGEWKEKTIDDISNVTGGGTPSTNNKNFWNGNINWFTPTEIGKTKYVFESKRKITEKGLSSSSAKLLPKGTVLLTSRAGIGDCAILQSESATNQGFQSLIPLSNIDSEFLYYLTLTLKDKFLRKASGSTFLEISPNNVRNTEVLIPIDKDKKEQEKIANFLSSIDNLIDKQTQKVEALKEYKKGLMQQLFPNNEVNK
ncbi:MAG: restriction endonuclease subunit S [Arcobacter sp.]|jgi:type I restriction enzyme S subunit|uniref:restriction endonuclease subunit S n=1 Tax=Arcobacter sp. TaxID=1872629 RepID=UPI002A764FEB|nr:restriction endonuclease subunit S [Arcobacter sp.]MDY3199657.1 restriction endonuclease subunit S [Arcobacter sp.]